MLDLRPRKDETSTVYVWKSVVKNKSKVLRPLFAAMGKKLVC